MELRKLLSQGFLPKELPPPFSSDSFGAFTEANFPLTVRGRTSILALQTRPCVHNFARPGNLRRVLSIPHPLNYYQVCNLLSNNWPAVEIALDRSILSLTRPTADIKEKRAIVGREEGVSLPRFRAENRASARYILRTDISRWYHSIYTHSIPWALVGKAAAKLKRRGGFGNDLDTAIRNCQDGQTLGILVGPDASFIVAEIIASAVDLQLQGLGLTGFRFMDDYEFAFSARSDAEAALPEIERVLREYELAINPNKTIIESLPIPLDREWSLEIRHFPFTHAAMDADLIRYFDTVFKLRLKYPYDTVLGYAVARLRSVSIDPSAVELFQNLLMQCVMVEPGTLQGVIWHLERIDDSSVTPRLPDVLNLLIRTHAPLSHGSEVAWALWAAIAFDIQIVDTAATALASSDDSVVALLALHARAEGQISPHIEFNKWASKMTVESFYDGNWLLAYEADIKGWLPSADTSNHVDADPNMSQLKDAGVSFYETDTDTPLSGFVYLGSYGEETSEEEPEQVDVDEEEFLF